MSFDSPLRRTSHETSPVEPTRASAGANHSSGTAAVATRQGGRPPVAGSKKEHQFRHAGRLAQLELINEEAELVALGEEWNRLFHDHGKAHQCFQSHAWCHHWCNHYLNKCAGDADRLVVVTARLDGELILVCPLVAYTQGGIVHLCWLGAPVSQYGDVLMSDHPAAPDLLKAGLEFAARVSGADLLDLRKVRRDSAAEPVLRESGALRLNTDQACYMDFASSVDPEAYAQRHSARSRKQRRRRRRRLAEQGGLKFFCVEPGAKASLDAVAAIQEKRRSLRRTGIVAPALEDKRFEHFFADVANEPGQSAECLISLLRCGDDVIAREIGLLCKDGYLAHVAVYDESYARFGPGVLQIEDMVAECYARGLATYDLLAPADAYKLSLADGAVEVCDYVRPLTWRGTIYAHSILRFARPLVRQLKDKVPAPFRHLLHGALLRVRALLSPRVRRPG